MQFPLFCSISRNISAQSPRTNKPVSSRVLLPPSYCLTMCILANKKHEPRSSRVRIWYCVICFTSLVNACRWGYPVTLECITVSLLASEQLQTLKDVQELIVYNPHPLPSTSMSDNLRHLLKC